MKIKILAGHATEISLKRRLASSVSRRYFPLKMGLAPPPSELSAADLARLELVSLPALEGFEAIMVYRFADTGEFVTDDEETAALIREAFPQSRVVSPPSLHG